MSNLPTNYWVTLRLQARPGGIWAAYEDSQGNKHTPPRDATTPVPGWAPRSLSVELLSPGGIPTVGPSLDTELYLPAEFDDNVRDMLAATPETRYGPHTTGPIPLPIFVNPVEGVEVFDWAAGIVTLLPTDVNQDRIQMVRLARQRWQARPPFRLPIRLLGVDTTSQYGLDRLRASSWYQNSPAVQQFGLYLEQILPENLWDTLQETVYDILVADSDAINSILQRIRHLRNPKETRPRLVVFLDYGASNLYMGSLSLPPGVSLLWVPLTRKEDSGPIIQELVLDVIHDYPLHEVARSLDRQFNSLLNRPVMLISDPLSNHDIRMAQAMAQLQEETFELSTRVKSGDVESFLARLRPEARERLAGDLRRAEGHQKGLEQALAFTRDLPRDFQQETYGLAPLAEAEATMADAREEHNRMTSSLESIAADEDMAEQVSTTQERRVEMTMDLRDEHGIYRPLEPDYQALQVRSTYRLNVYVGHRLPNSLVVGEPPPLDPLLPEPEGEEGHELEVAVFEKDFKVLSPRVQKLYLPRFGGSRPVAIECQAPENPGHAELRVSVYYKNYLLQSFLMKAEVQDEYIGFTERQITVELDFSRTARFANLPELNPRLLTIGSNQNTSGDTHSFLIKKDQSAAQPITMTEAVASEQITKFRNIMEEVATDVTHFEPDLSGRPVHPDDQKAFEDVIRDLARLGQKLYQFLWVRMSVEMKNKLRQVRDVDNEIIQVTRHDPAFAFPWPIIYDYRLPKQIAGAEPKRVCMGRPFDDAPDEPPTGRSIGCPHNPHVEVYCVEGFWGIRHRLEQLIEQGSALRDAVNEVVIPRAREGVCMATGVKDRHTQTLLQNLQNSLQDRFSIMKSQQDLFDRLWTTKKRPAIFILLSHLETAEIEGQPVGPRMLLSPMQETGTVPLEAWLQPDDITLQSIEIGDWGEQPHTVVMLMACESAANDIATLSNYFTSLNSVGAGAIVGTETKVFSDLVSLFTKEVTMGLWDNEQTLGEVIQDFNRRMIASYNPLAFVFNCFGNADLKLVPEKDGQQPVG